MILLNVDKKHIMNYLYEKHFLQRDSELDTLLNNICVHFRIGKKQLKGKSRVRSLAYPRQLLMFIAVVVLKKKSTEVAKYLNRDHTTILHGVKNMKKLLLTDIDFFNDVKPIFYLYNLQIQRNANDNGEQVDVSRM
tara:strand:+ start:3570 stop:3977 length:408 start_codon:yes stop_codon:yes gene_type:complete